jgi:hypothetical protein
MKNILILFICMLLSASVLYAASPLPTNLTAQPTIASEGAWSTLVPGDGSPQPVCAPGRPCNNDQLQQLAGDGSPQPVCAPGRPCNNDQLQQLAGDGSPQPVCAPGRPCNNDQEKLLMAL